MAESKKKKKRKNVINTNKLNFFKLYSNYFIINYYYNRQLIKKRNFFLNKNIYK